MKTKNYRAFTLVEMLIASSIFVIVAVSLYSAFQTGFFGYNRINSTLFLYQNANRSLERMNLDLRNCFAYSGDKTNFKGSSNEIRFFSLTDGFSEGMAVRNFSFIYYRTDSDRLLRLCRTNSESLNDKSAIEPEEMASGIERLSLSYGYVPAPQQPLEWKNNWDDQEKLPDAVRIRLTVKDKVKKDFERTIYLMRQEKQK